MEKLDELFHIYRTEGALTTINRPKSFFSNKLDSIITKYLSRKSLSNEDLLEYAKTKGIVYNWEQSSLDVDISISQSNVIDCSQRTMCVAPYAKIFTHRGIALTKKNQPILQSICQKKNYINYAIDDTQLYAKIDLFVPDFNLRTSQKYRNVINMIMHPDTHYGHWLVEYLPKFYHLHQYEDQTDTEPNILINENPPQWMIDSIVALGYSKERITEFNHTKCKVEDLLIPLSSVTGHKLQFSPIEFRWLRNQYEKKSISTCPTSERIYVSRQKCERRKVHNFAELQQYLVNNGFDVIRPEKFQFSEQVEIFSNANIIMGGFGSGLHNMVYARDAKVIEFLPPEYDRSDTLFFMNRALASSLGHEYASIEGTGGGSIPKITNKGLAQQNHNYNISIEEVENAI